MTPCSVASSSNSLIPPRGTSFGVANLLRNNSFAQKNCCAINLLLYFGLRDGLEDDTMAAVMRLIIGTPATGDDFFPRDDVLAVLRRGLVAEHVLFIAPRRTGKTSLLKALARQSLSLIHI